jgi:nuclease HARBI1
MIGHLFGPISCKRHDAYLLRRSELHEKLTDVLALFPVDYLCYGDGAYPLLRYIKRGVKRVQNPGPNDAVNVDNGRKMSKVRECVEWGFGKIVNLWAFLDFEKNLQMYFCSYRYLLHCYG